MRVLIVANGEITSWESLPHGDIPFDHVIAVDGGWQRCQTLGVDADIVIGDLDSLPDTILEHLQQTETELVPFPPEKDEIDLELALLYAMEMSAKEIVVVGGLGGRFDMSMANISLLAHPQLNYAPIEFWHEQQKIWLIRPPGDEIEGKTGDTLSLLPLAGEATGVQTTNLAYPLQHESLPFGPARGVSNVLTAEFASVSLESGMLLAVLTQGRA